MSEREIFSSSFLQILEVANDLLEAHAQHDRHVFPELGQHGVMIIPHSMLQGLVMGAMLGQDSHNQQTIDFLAARAWELLTAAATVVAPVRFLQPELKALLADALVNAGDDKHRVVANLLQLIRDQREVRHCFYYEAMVADFTLQNRLMRIVFETGTLHCAVLRFFLQLPPDQPLDLASFPPDFAERCPCTEAPTYARFLSWLSQRHAQQHAEQQRVDNIPVAESRAGGACSICQDDIAPGEATAQLKCGHVFHETTECSSRVWFREKGTCPICRTPIE